MTERRYDETEVREIFERATEAHEVAVRTSSPAEGLTLHELQAIGRDVGIAPELVARAAASLEVLTTSEGRRVLGLPVGVGRTVELSRPLTEQEWHQVVVDLRDTFAARGKLRDDGAFKQWTNGNLEALLEPTPAGQRLRLRTQKQSALSLMGGGAGMIAMAAVVGVVNVFAGGFADPGTLSVMGLLSTIGAGMMGWGALQVPGWARLRRRQMEEVGERAAALAAAEPQQLAEPKEN